MEKEIKNKANSGALEPELDIMSEEDLSNHIKALMEDKVKKEGIIPLYSRHKTKKGSIGNGWSEEGIQRFNTLLQCCCRERVEEEINSDERMLELYRALAAEGPNGKRKRMEVEEETFRKDQKAGMVKTAQFHLKLDPAKLVGKSKEEIDEKLKGVGINPEEFWKVGTNNQVYECMNETDDEGDDTGSGAGEKEAPVGADTARNSSNNKDGGSTGKVSEEDDESSSADGG
jgi:hypothetical protein